MAFTSPFGLLPSMIKSKGLSLACCSKDTDLFFVFAEKIMHHFPPKNIPMWQE